MYALINTLNGHRYDDGEILGDIISRHRTPAAAAKADDRHQRAVRRANGSSSYIPTAIIDIAWSDDGRARGQSVDVGW